MFKRSLKQHLILAGWLFWTAGFFVLAVLFYLDLQCSMGTSSTAAIGYFFLPFGAAIAALPDGVAGLCLGYVLFRLRQPAANVTLYKPVAALLSALGILAWQGKFIADELNWPCETDQVEVSPCREGLQKLLNQPTTRHNSYVLGTIAMNPCTNGQMLDQIAHLDDPTLHDEMGDHGRNTKGLSVMRLVAKHANVYPQTLDFLATSPNEYVRSSVAANAKLSRIRLRRLASEHSYLIDGSLAANAATPVDILDTLAHSQDTSTRLSLVKNPTTPGRVIDFLSHDTEPSVSQQARTRLTQGDSAYFHRPAGKVGSP